MREDDVTKKTDEQQRKEHTSYEKLVPTRPKEVTGEANINNERDLGTVGGGTIPRHETGGAGNARGDMGTSASETTGRADTEEQRERGSGNVSGQRDQRSSTSKNTVDPQAGKSIGGHTPVEPQTSMGDRDARVSGGQGTNQDIIDPMTSRTPEHTNDQKPSQQDQERESCH